MVSQVKQLYRFGDFCLDTSKRRLLRSGEALPLTPKTFDTLVLLIENRGQVVQKDELMDRIWPGIAVEENNLNQNISALRKVLGEKRGKPEFIITVPGRGYSFVGDIYGGGSNDRRRG